MSSGGSKGGRRGRAPPTPPGVQIRSISCSFWEILAKSYVGTPPGSWRPLLGEILDPPLVRSKLNKFEHALGLRLGGPYTEITKIIKNVKFTHKYTEHLMYKVFVVI